MRAPPPRSFLIAFRTIVPPNLFRPEAADPSDALPARQLPGVHDRIENPPSVLVSEDLLGAAIGMGHHPEDVAAGVADAGDGPQRAVRIAAGRHLSPLVAVAEHHLALLLDLLQDLFRREVAAFPVPHGD